ncbi:tail fiber assembly protein [Escherichia coli]|uniref:tail fiber assembly protein n=1 Tax=Escherichia coli TaxID=562 RepID=UPI00200CB73C|nr:tail fiber assembly protein [Escherichia coli]EKR7491570.1 tail fiber assembly protein [Escherichia coli]
MEFLWSAKNLSFFPEALMQEYIAAGWDLSDAVEISDELRMEYGGVWPQGKILSSRNGMPAWADIPPPTKEELIQAAEIERQRLLKYADDVMLDWRTELMLGEISDANKAKLSAWLEYKNRVKAVDVTTDPENVNWPVPPEA